MRSVTSALALLGAAYGLGQSYGWGEYGGGIQWRGVRGYMEKHRQHRRIRNRMARESRRRNRS